MTRYMPTPCSSLMISSMELVYQCHRDSTGACITEQQCQHTIYNDFDEGSFKYTGAHSIMLVSRTAGFGCVSCDAIGLWIQSLCPKESRMQQLRYMRTLNYMINLCFDLVCFGLRPVNKTSAPTSRGLAQCATVATRRRILPRITLFQISSASRM